MRLPHFSALAFVLLGPTLLACSAPNDEIFMGNDDAGGSSAGAREPSSGAGMASSGGSQGGSASAGSSSKAGSASGGTGTGGLAAAGSPNGGAGPDPWEPCAGKACGDVCQPCDPNDADCVAPAVTVEMTCSSTGECSVGPPGCTIPNCEGTQKYYALGCDSVSPIAYPLFTPGCYDSCADTNVGDACPDGYTCTVVWHDPSAGCAPGGTCIGACGAQATICIAN